MEAIFYVTCYCGSHSDYQNFVVTNLRKYYPNPDSIEKVTVAELLPELENTSFQLDSQPYASLFKIYKKKFLDCSVSKGLINTESLALAGDGTPVVTSHRERKKRVFKCSEKGIFTSI